MAVAKNAIKRMVVEEGIVLSKVFKPASDEWVNSRGEKVAAQPDRYLAVIASSSECTDENGLADVSVLEYPCEKALYDFVSYLTPVKRKFEFTPYGNKAVSFEPLKI